MTGPVEIPLPPTRAESLLRRVLPSGHVEQSIRGDLREEFVRTHSKVGPVFAALWYWGVTLRLCLVYVRRRDVASNVSPLSRREPMGRFAQDVRYAFRVLWHRPSFTGIVLATLALAVGASTAIFTVVNGVVFAPLPYAEPDRLAAVGTNTGGTGWYGSSPAEFLDLREGLSGFERLAGYTRPNVTLGDSTRPSRVNVVFATADLFPVLGVRPVLGRVFAAEEDVPGAARTAVVSHSFWRQQLGGADDVLGRVVQLSGAEYTVIGVMPSGFAFPDPSFVAWVPYQMDVERARQNRANHFVSVVGRARRGVTVEQVDAEAQALVARSIQTYAENYSERGYRIRVQPLHRDLVGEARAPLLIVFGAVLFLLLIACVNVANLVLARGETRVREIAVRAAMGATRRRLVWLVTTESAVLAVIGGVAGLGVAAVGTRMLLGLAPETLPRLENVTLDLPVLLFSLAVVAGTGLIFGLLPAWHATAVPIHDGLRAGGRGMAGRRGGRALRRLLVTTQVAFAVVLVTGAALMARTLANLAVVDAGLDPANVLTLAVNPPAGTYSAPEQIVGVYQEMVREVEALPNVRSVAAVGWLPFAGRPPQWSLVLEGRPVTNIGAAPDGVVQQVTADYFATVGIEILRGRGFTAADVAGSLPVTVVSEAMAATFWPGEDPIGRRFRVFSGDEWLEIVGVVRDVKFAGLAADPEPNWYVPHAQAYETAYLSLRGMSLVIRTDGPPGAVAASVRAAVGRIAPAAPVSNVRPMVELVARSIDRERFTLFLLALFSGVALVLATVGVYGVVAYSVSRRRREIGLRLALGATATRVVNEVTGEGLRLAGWGIVGGVVTALVSARALASMMYDVTTSDPLTYVGVVALLTGATLVASFIPARRASIVDPAETLNVE